MTPPNRLKELRLALGWSQGRLAQEIGASQPMVALLEVGKRNFTLDQAERIAGALGVSVDALRANTEGDEAAQRPPPARLSGKAPVLRVREYEIAALGRGEALASRGAEDASALAVAEWLVPRDFVPERHRGADLAVVRVADDGMAPLLRPGDRVLVAPAPRGGDRPRAPPEGTYLVHDGAALSVRRVRPLPGEPPQVELSGANPLSPARAVPLDAVRVLGRVLGRWEWWA